MSRATLWSRLRSKMYQGPTARCRAVVPRLRLRQDRALVAARRLGNKLDLSPPLRFSAPSPTWRAAGQLAFSWLQGQPTTCRRPPYDTWLHMYMHVPVAARCPLDPSLARWPAQDLSVAKLLKMSRATQKSLLRSKMSQDQIWSRCLALVAAPPPAPGSCPGARLAAARRVEATGKLSFE
jgi:hypothetical protein